MIYSKHPLAIFYTLQIVSACLMLFSPLYASALGVKDIEVTSALNQPLNARVGLNLDKPQDIYDIKVRLASTKKFEQSGMERPYFLTRLKFKPVIADDGTAYILITSSDRVREPYLSFLLEVSWPGGTFIKEFTVLIDPPNLYEPSSGTDSNLARRGNVKTPLANSKLYGPVQEAETLWIISQKTRPSPSIPIKQMIQAIYQENPEAFVRGDINLLKHGVTLRIPDHISIAGIRYRDAIQLQTEQKQELKESISNTLEPALNRYSETTASRQEERNTDKTSTETPQKTTPTIKPETQTASPEVRSKVLPNKLEIAAVPESQINEVMQSQGEKVYPKSEIEQLRGSIADRSKDFSDLKSINRDLVQLRSALQSKIDLIYLELEKTNQAIAKMSEKLEKTESATTPDNSDKNRLKNSSGSAVTATTSTELFEPEMTQGINPTTDQVASKKISRLESEIAELKLQRESIQTQKYVIIFLLLALLLAVALIFFRNRIDIPKLDSNSLKLILERLNRSTQSLKQKTETSTFQDEFDYEIEPERPELPETSERPEMPFDLPDNNDEPEPYHTELLTTLTNQDEGLYALEPETDVNDDHPIQNAVSVENPPRVDKNDIEYILTSVDVYIAYRRFSEAELILHDAIEKDPGEPELKRRLIEIYILKKDADAFAQALEKYQQELSTQAPRIWQELLQEGKHLLPNHPDVQKNITETNTGRNTDTDGETDLETDGIQLDPDNIIDEVTLSEIEPLEDDTDKSDLEFFFQESKSKRS